MRRRRKRKKNVGIKWRWIFSRRRRRRRLGRRWRQTEMVSSLSSTWNARSYRTLWHHSNRATNFFSFSYAQKSMSYAPLSIGLCRSAARRRRRLRHPSWHEHVPARNPLLLSSSSIQSPPFCCILNNERGTSTHTHARTKKKSKRWNVLWGNMSSDLRGSFFLLLLLLFSVVL